MKPEDITHRVDILFGEQLIGIDHGKDERTIFMEMKRKKFHAEHGRYRSLKVTWYRFDCDQDGCRKCKICKYLDYLSWPGIIGMGSVERDEFLDMYLHEVRGI